MTQLLQQAFTQASQLPAQEQDAIAALLLAELESERRWAASFAASQDQLSSLADEALAEFEAGETQPQRAPRASAGALKGMVAYGADNFGAPLPDLREYTE